jgi:GH25 family lysozyme M1 (1,4-beta-N-acetylmuramidase)
MVYSSNAALTQAQMQVNAQYILNYLTSRGWTPQAVCGVLGNAQTESYVNPGVWQGLNSSNTSGGFGLLQWTPSTKLTDWCAAQTPALDPTQMDSQLQRIIWEVNNNQQWYDPDGTTFAQYSQKTDTAYNLGILFLDNYERPANMNQPIRGTQAQSWYDTLVASGASLWTSSSKQLGNTLLFDMYSGNTINSWLQVKQSGIQGVHMRASRGHTGSSATGYNTTQNDSDTNLYTRIQAAKAQGLLVGFYHYAAPTMGAGYDLTEADTEANYFASTIQTHMQNAGYGSPYNYPYGDLMPVIDFEEPTGAGTNKYQVLDWMRRFVTTFEQTTGWQIMVYTGQWVYQLLNITADDNWLLKARPLWTSEYYENTTKLQPGQSQANTPTQYGGWQSYAMWQYSSSGGYLTYGSTTDVINGISGDIDRSFGPPTINPLMAKKAVNTRNINLDGNTPANRNTALTVNRTQTKAR